MRFSRGIEGCFRCSQTWSGDDGLKHELRNDDLSLWELGSRSAKREFTKEIPDAGAAIYESKDMNGTENNYETASGNTRAAQETWSAAKDRASTALHRGELYVRENPVPSILTGVGIGFILGLLAGWCFADAHEETHRDILRRDLRGWRRKLHWD